MAAQAQQPVIQILLLAVEFHGQRIFFFLPLLFLLFFQLCRRFITRQVSQTRAISPQTAVASQRFASGASQCCS